MKLTKDEVLKIYDRVFHYHFQQPHQINNILTVAAEIQDAYQAKNADQLRDAEWQPIETAPKETEIFIGRFIDEVFVFGKAVCFYEVGNEFAGEFYRGWFWSIDDVCESVADCPTHWMPLPKPPAMKESK